MVIGIRSNLCTVSPIRLWSKITIHHFFSFAQLSLIILQEKVVKHVHLEEEVKVIQIQSSDGNLPETTNGESKDPVAETKKSDGKIKEKLALLKKQTEEEVIKMKEKTSGLVNSLKAQKEQTRGRSRYQSSVVDSYYKVRMYQM